jgi:hypothetical protein
VADAAVEDAVAAAAGGGDVDVGGDVDTVDVVAVASCC